MKNSSYRWSAARRDGVLAALAVITILFLSLPSPANAQTGGQLLWSVNLAYTPQTAAPRVAPNANIYFHSDDFYAISPSGQILWTKPASDPKAVDVGPNGTVYFGSGGSIFAYTPGGKLVWTFTEPPGGQGLMAGPSVGPDGNIYAVSDGGGLGAFSLTRAGQLRWNVPGYVNFAGTGLTPVPLGKDRLYFAEDVVPGCTEFSEGLDAVDFTGQLLWCVSFSGISRPIAAPNGDALVHDFGVLYDFRPDGTLAWSFSFPFPSGTLLGPSTGPDGNIYIFHNFDNLWSLTPDGVKRWETDAIANGFPVPPTVSPDGKILVFGTEYGFGINGALFAVDTATGVQLWSFPITGPSAGIAGPVSFSADGKIVYAPTTEIGGVNKLLAVSVHGGPALGVTGTCPGTATISASGLTPGASAQIWSSPRAGSTTISSGSCTGTVLGLANAQLLATKSADASGKITLNPTLGASSCGRLLQVLDTTTCGTSNLGRLP
ncbi:MAG: PQQ-like beta-propeller repeat protein [Acidobacteriales bacterium]|nr:PQQ-like beta-propeller repeat protein [Terriglobales bacterium]